MKKITPLLIITIFLLAVVMPFVKVDSESAIVDNSFMDFQAIEEPTTPITITSDDWVSGETVKTDIEFPISIIDYSTITYYAGVDSYVGQNIYYPANSASNDGNLMYIKYWIETPIVGASSFLVSFRIYAGGEGLLSWDWAIKYEETVGSNILTGYETDNYNVTNDFVDSQGFINLVFGFVQLSSTSNGICNLNIVEVDDYHSYTILDTSTRDISSLDDIQEIYFFIDEMSFVQTTVENNIRSEYQCVSDTVITHKLTIPSVSFAKEINVYAPTHWTYSSISPTATVTKSGSDYTITSPTELEYEILFTSNSTSLLAIEDVSSTYLQDIGFESGEWTNDWQDINLEMDSIDVVTDISSEGYHSLKLESSSTDNFYLSSGGEVKLSEGYYYVSFDIYVSSGTSNIYFKNYVNADWESNYAYEHGVDGVNRWNKKFFFIELDKVGTVGDNERNIVLNFGGDITSYIDNFRIFQPSTEIDTVDLDEYEISSTFRVWDGYQNPTLKNTDNIYFELWDRCDSILIDSEDTVTNSLGVASWDYESDLIQKEYAVWVWCQDNKFGDHIYDEYDDYWDFDEGDNELFDTFSGSIWDVADGVFNITSTVVGTSYALRDEPVSIWDASKVMKIMFYAKAGNGGTAFRINTKNSDGGYYASYFNCSTANYEYIQWDNMVNLNTIIHRVYLYPCLVYGSQSSDIGNWIKFDYIMLAEEQYFSPFYFTPSYPYNIELSTDGNYIDFSEYSISSEDTSKDVKAIGWEKEGSANVTNGYLTWIKNDLRYYTYTLFDFEPETDFEDYCYFITRVWCNESGHDIRARWLNDIGGTFGETVGLTIADTWVICEEDLSLDSNWGEMRYEDFGIMINNIPTEPYQALEIRIDYIRLVHVEEPETYLTNTYLGFGSENDKWISAIYSDDIFLGYYNDPNIVYLNQTIGIHNISRLPVARQGETKAFLYSNIYTYTYQVSDPSNYFLLLNPPSFDIDAGLIYIDLVTYYGNCTYQVMMNESSLGDAISEGSSVWSCDFSQAGFYNFTVYVYQGAEVWTTLITSITIPSTEEESLQLLLLTKDVDTSVSQIFVNYYSNWGNTSLIVFDNSTQLGNELSGEGASIWDFSSIDYYGYHNITIEIYHATIIQFIISFSFTIQKPSLEIFTVHFDLFTIAGIGLPFETAKIYVNDSRIYNPQQYYLKDSFIEVQVRDYYNHLLFATNATITANRDIALYVRLFGQQIRNTYKIPIEVYFISTFDSNYNHSYIVAAEGSISVLLFSSSYHVLVKPLQDEYQNSTHVTYFYATTSEYQDLGDETKSYTISMETDLEPLDLEEPKEVRTWPAWVIAASAIFINAILISFIGAMGKWGIVKIWNFGLYYPNKGANWILRKFRSERELHWCVEHKGGLEFVTPEQYRKAEALKKEGQF